MKTSHPFWRNHFLKIFFWPLVLGLGISVKTLAKSPSSKYDLTPGLIETIKEINSTHAKQYKVLEERIKANPKLLGDLSDVKSMKIDPYFMRSIIFRSPMKYLDLIDEQNECTFYSLLENNLLKSVQGKIDNIIVTIETSQGKKESALVSKESFLDTIYKDKCSEVNKMKVLFEKNAIKKTFSSISMKTPKNKTQCHTIHSEWRKNAYLPFLCKIPHTMFLAENLKNHPDKRKTSQISSDASFYKQTLDYFQMSYLTNLCENIDSESLFCSSYLTNDIWNKVINGESPKYLMKYKCLDVLNKNSIDLNDYRACSTQFNKSPEVCLSEGASNYPSLFPYEKCEIISETLKKGKLKTDYHDCPARIDNESITNISRIISHFDKDSFTTGPNTCASEANRIFSNMIFKYGHEKAWPLKVCYFDKIKEKEVCIPYIPGDNSNSEIAEAKVVSNIIKRLKSTSSDLECKIVDSKTYNPNLLEFKNGCFIVYDFYECSMLHCPKKIVHDQQEITGLKYTGKPLFDYFPNSFANESYALSNILAETYNKKVKKILNFTFAQQFLKSHKAGIIHGVGCAEDLSPQHFKRMTFNQCRPTNFIIDGFEIKEGSKGFVLRLAIEDVHSPRLIQWGQIFQAVSNYRTLHPLETWTLYGIY